MISKCAIFSFALVLTAGACAGDFHWTEGTPASQGMSAIKLDQLKDGLAERGTKALLVIRNDTIVYQWYSKDHGPDKRHFSASMAKALVGSVSLAVAMSDGRIGLDDSAAQYVPSWHGDPVKSKITIRQLGSHTSGLDDAESDYLPHEKLTGWKGEFWNRSDPPTDPFSISRDKTPILFQPGTKFQYSNPGIAMLGYAVAAALVDAPEKDLRTLLRDRVMRPIGVPDRAWSVGYGRTFHVNGLPLVAAWGGGSFTARAVARIGRLMLREGDWEGRRLISRDAVVQTTHDDQSSDGIIGNGIGWFTNAGNTFESLPRDAFFAEGAQEQILLVVPSLQLIVVRNGLALGKTRSIDDYISLRETHLYKPLMDAVVTGLDANKTSTAPYPPSRAIQGIEWKPASTIIRKASGCDNWPMTWGNDDHLYTAYGDGWGFEPHVERKLSLGLAKVIGGPTQFRGVNIRADNAEQIGQGDAGKKASGMLMVDGILYMLVRNAGNAQLGWSNDHGQTWAWSDWKWTTSFGCPTFLNFGRNYSSARDDYVYVYSHDNDSAYVAANRMVMARVHKDRIRDRDAYDFFKELKEDGQADWTSDIQKRGAVFVNPSACYRSGITFNAALKRYLWCQTLPQSNDSRGPRFRGGFGIYDAPEPWGPWTTVYFNRQWDVGPGETNSFPTKWMSGDGKTLHLVFSGDDCLSVRQAMLRTN